MWCIFLATFSPNVNIFSLLSTILYFNHINLSSPWLHYMGDRHMCSQTFLYKIQFQTTFIWSFCECDPYFWQRSALKWMYFLFWVQYYISTISIFRAPSSTLEGDTHMHSRTFLYEIRFQTSFTCSFFWCDAYFWQCWPLNWMYFGVSGGLPYDVIT